MAGIIKLQVRGDYTGSSDELETHLFIKGVDKMKAIPYFNFPNTKEVLAFYEKIGAKNIRILLASDEMFADMSPEMAPKDPDEFVMNAEFELFGNTIYASDSWDRRDVDHSGSNISFVFTLSNDNEVQAVKDFFDKAIENGFTVEMPLEASEWTELFGMLKDPFGLSWMFSGE